MRVEFNTPEQIFDELASVTVLDRIVRFRMDRVSDAPGGIQVEHEEFTYACWITAVSVSASGEQSLLEFGVAYDTPEMAAKLESDLAEVARDESLKLRSGKIEMY
jgi:hypothetical protein